MIILPKHWSNGYVGFAYDTHDCWQLISDVLERVFDIQCPVTAESSDYDSFSDSWSQVDVPEEGDLVLFSGHRHIGIMVSRERFLHTTSDTDAVVERLDDFWSDRLDGFYRHVSRAGDSLPLASGHKD